MKLKKVPTTVGLVFLFLLACSLPTGRSLAQEQSSKAAEPVLWPHDMRYRLQIGDAIEITFRLTPEFNQAVTIQPDGFINLRELPDLRAAGKTTPELTEALKKLYSGILHDPVVTVQLKDFEKPYFIAGGEVGRPGKYDLRGDTTVTQAVQIAGGFKESSRHSQVLLWHRISDEWTEQKLLDVKAMLTSGNLKEDVHLRPGDMIYIPQNTISKIQRFIPSMSIGSYLPR